MLSMPSLANNGQYRRTKKACLTCRNKKLKCNGLQPCATCLSRQNQCTYAIVSDGAESRARHEHQRRRQSYQQAHRLESIQAGHPHLRSPRMLPLSQTMSSNPVSSESRIISQRTGLVGLNDSMRFEQVQPKRIGQFHTESRSEFGSELLINLNEASHMKKDVPVRSQPEMAIGESNSAYLEEDPDGESLEEHSRMLQDGKGRLLYLGESASLSYLGTLRRLVESTLGPSDFTRDSHRHKILEGSLPLTEKATRVLPDLETAKFLLDSFFSGTVGIINIFNRNDLTNEVSKIYENPLQADQSRLSILNLVFAIGLQLTRSSAAHSDRDNQILQRLDVGKFNTAEMFYINATHFNDPMCGFEDGDIASIQTLVLITLFMLTVAKRNAAWAYFGMAVRSGYALGLHRKQAALAFTVPEQRIRNNVWRTLYVMDCFLSAMLGRPNGINSRDAADSFADDDSVRNRDTSDGTLEEDAFSASVRSSRLIGDVLSLVYAERKVSVKLAHFISNKFETWKNALPPALNWQNISLPNDDPLTTLAQLHVNLSYFHGIILLTRPFLMQNILSQIRPSRNVQSPPSAGVIETRRANVAQLSSACVRSALYSIDTVQSALLKRALPRRDPFVIYWLFTASLIVFSNGFCPVYSDIDNGHAIQTALGLQRHLGEVDPLARRFLQILLAFEQAIEKGKATGVAQTTSKPGGKDVFSIFFGTVNSSAVSADVGGRSQMPAGRNSNSNSNSNSNKHIGISTGMDDWEDFMTLAGAGLQAGVDYETVQSMTTDTDLSSNNALDYSFDFDAFITSNSQESEQRPWAPLFRTMHVD